MRQALVSLEARMDRRFELMDSRVTAFEQKVDARFTHIDARFTRLDQRFDSIGDKFSRYFVWMLATQVTTLAAVITALT